MILNPWQSRAASSFRILLLACICQHPTVDLCAQSPEIRAFDQQAREHAKGYQWLEWSTTRIGHRLTGSEGGRKAEEMADSLFRSFPMDTTYRSSFSAQTWTREQVTLTIIDNEQREPLDVVSLANTPLDADVTAQLIDAGNGLAADLRLIGSGMMGRIALINLGLVDAPEGTKNLHRSEKSALAIAAGAAGIVFVNQATGHVLLTGTASIDGSFIGIPAVSISAEDGTVLRDRFAVNDRLELHLTMMNRSALVHANNIIAELRGSEWPDEVILIGGHLDSWDLATGATDNGLGSYSILDMARAMVATGYRPKRTIRFVLFMGEEQGLLGSRALVKEYLEQGSLQNIRCMLNLDMSGNPRGFGVAAPGGWPQAVAQVNQQILQIDTIDFKGEVSERIWIHSDHQPFLLSGVPVIYPLSDLGKDVYGCYHSSCDDIHLVDPKAMVNNVRFVGLLLQGLADAHQLPPHFSNEELRQSLIANDLEEQLRIGGDWPWE